MNASPFLNSEEAKSTTWLHPVSGEAVITGHRKTPGEMSVTERLSSFSVVFHGSRVRRHVLLVTHTPKPILPTVCVAREAVTSMLCFLMHEWAFGARAVKSEPSRAHLCPAREPPPHVGGSVSEVVAG